MRDESDISSRFLAKTPDSFDLIALCGGRQEGDAHSEARVGSGFFRSTSGQLARKFSRRILLEEASNNTVRNVYGLIERIGSNSQLAGKGTILTVLSSDYHIRRIEAVDRYMPSQSLLQPIRERLSDVRLLSSPYYYDCVSEPHRRWLATLYRLVDSLVIMRVNVEGVLSSMLEHIVPEVAWLFGRSISRLCDQICSRDRPSSCQNVDSVVGKALSSLLDCHACFNELCGLRLLGVKESDRLRSKLTSLSTAIQELRNATDQDEPVLQQARL